MVVSAIVASVALASVLTVVIYAIKFRKYHQRKIALEAELSKNSKGIELIRASLGTMEQLNSTQLREIESLQEQISKLNTEAKIDSGQIDSLSRDLSSSRDSVSSLEQQMTKLRSELRVSTERLAKADEDVEQAVKRNEFWVAQVAELRIKNDALRLKNRS